MRATHAGRSPAPCPPMHDPHLSLPLSPSQASRDYVRATRGISHHSLALVDSLVVDLRKVSEQLISDPAVAGGGGGGSAPMYVQGTYQHAEQILSAETGGSCSLSCMDSNFKFESTCRPPPCRYGMASFVPDRRMVAEFLVAYQDVMLEP